MFFGPLLLKNLQCPPGDKSDIHTECFKNQLSCNKLAYGNEILVQVKCLRARGLYRGSQQTQIWDRAASPRYKLHGNRHNSGLSSAKIVLIFFLPGRQCVEVKKKKNTGWNSQTEQKLHPFLLPPSAVLVLAFWPKFSWTRRIWEARHPCFEHLAASVCGTRTFFNNWCSSNYSVLCPEEGHTKAIWWDACFYWKEV